MPASMPGVCDCSVGGQLGCSRTLDGKDLLVLHPRVIFASKSKIDGNSTVVHRQRQSGRKN